MAKPTTQRQFQYMEMEISPSIRERLAEMALGPRQLIDLALPTGVDATEILRFQMEEGMTPTEVIQMAGTVLGEANEMLLANYGGLMVTTERLFARYRSGSGSARSMTPRKTELVQPDGRRSQKVGHMLPRNDYEDALEWSRLYMRRANREDLRDDVLEVRDAWVNLVDFEIVTRMLSKTENAIGSAGWSVPWAIGTGTNVNFIPIQWRGTVFQNTHTHFIKVNAAITAANALTTLQTMAQHLSHHGHTGRKVAIVSEADVAVYAAMAAPYFAAFKPNEFMAVTGGSSAQMFVQGELQGVPGEIFGYLNTLHGVVELRYHERFPSGYLFMTKTYGVNDPRNGLAIRTEPGIGFGMRVDPQVNRSLSPELDKVLFPATHGVGVNDRTNGVAAQIDDTGSTYDEPTIS
jgi:hypothetical protein